LLTFSVFKQLNFILSSLSIWVTKFCYFCFP
jgi:hypothetical protein